MTQIDVLVVGQLQTNAYLLSDPETLTTFIVDPGDDGGFIINKILEKGFTPCGIIATHGHFDHIMGAFEIQKTFDLPLYANQDDAFLFSNMQKSAKFYLKHNYCDPPPTLTHPVCGNQMLPLGKSGIRIISLPGHTPGSIGLHDESAGILVCGDTIFSGGQVGRTDFSYSSSEKLQNSLDYILSFPGDTVLYPGHGQQTSVGRELTFRKVNR